MAGKHVHSFDREEVVKVPLRGEKGGIKAFDYFTKWVCECGAKTPAKRERLVI
jgi:hypothetical protein